MAILITYNDSDGWYDQRHAGSLRNLLSFTGPSLPLPFLDPVTGQIVKQPSRFCRAGYCSAKPPLVLALGMPAMALAGVGIDSLRQPEPSR
jgi:hypothetical protein